MWRRATSHLRATATAAAATDPASGPTGRLLPLLLLRDPGSCSASVSGAPRGEGAADGGALLRLNDLRDNPGATKQKTRKGRSIESGKGKTVGRDHKGYKARGKAMFGFEGGQTPLRRRLPRRGFKNKFSLTFQVISMPCTIRFPHVASSRRIYAVSPSGCPTSDS
jgi:large subunit ribosomal protein L15